MAGSKHVQLTEPRHAEQGPNNGAQVACRLCGQMFAKSVDLVNHIDMHVLRDTARFRRASDFSLFQIPPTLPLNSSQPTVLPATNKPTRQSPHYPPTREINTLLFNQHRIAIPPRNPSFATPPLASPDYIFRPRQAKQISAEEVADDGTRPYLRQLDGPIPDRRKRARILETDKTGEPSVVPPNLTLKL